MRLLYGTANPAKLKHMKEMLGDLDIEIIGLKDVNIHVGDIDESGNNPVENARIKALAYYKASGMPVFSCDSGLYIEGLDTENQPGVHVRRVKGKLLNDDEMIEYYTNLALKAGGTIKAKYKNAICLVLDDEKVFEYDGVDISSEDFLLASKAHEKRDSGFPLDSISLEIGTGNYYYDSNSLSKYESRNAMSEGYKSFFKRTIFNK